MNRRTFFRSLLLGSAAIPGALRTVSVPPPAEGTLILSQPIIRDMVLRGSIYLTKTVKVIERCLIKVPWRFSGQMMNMELRPETDPLLVRHNMFLVEPKPLWARLTDRVLLGR